MANAKNPDLMPKNPRFSDNQGARSLPPWPSATQTQATASRFAPHKFADQACLCGPRFFIPVRRTKFVSEKILLAITFRGGRGCECVYRTPLLWGGQTFISTTQNFNDSKFCKYGSLMDLLVVRCLLSPTGCTHGRGESTAPTQHYNMGAEL